VDFFYSDSLNQLTQGLNNLPLSIDPNAPLQAVRRDGLSLSFQPYTGSSAYGNPREQFATGTVIKFAMQAVDAFGKQPVAITSNLAYDSVLKYYTGSIDTGSVQMCAAFLANGGATPGIDVKTTTTVNITAANIGRLVTSDNAGAQSIILPSVTTATALTNGASLWIMAIGTGIATVSAAAPSNLINPDVSAALAAGVPVLATWTTGDHWTLTVPVEPNFVDLQAEWSWTKPGQKPESTPFFNFRVINDINRDGQDGPTSTSNAANYALVSYVTAQVATLAALGGADFTGPVTVPTVATGDNSTSAANTALVTAKIGVESSNRASAISAAVLIETNARIAADALLAPRLMPVTAAITTASYTLTLADAFTRRPANYAGAFTLTVPLNSAVAFPVGTQLIIDRQIGGGTTITPTSGVTIDSLNGILAQAINDLGLIIKLTKIATDRWTAELTRPPNWYEIERGAAHQQTLTDVTSSGGTVAWDMNNGLNAYLPFSAFVTRVLGLPTNLPPAGASGKIIIKQDSVGSRTITYNGIFLAINAAIALNGTASTITVIDWYYNGTNILLNKA